jgi:hypothetical protein
MSDPFAGIGIQKAQGAADALNNFIRSLILRCTKGEGEVRDYFEISIIGYGAQSNTASSLLAGDFLKISDLEKRPLDRVTIAKKIPDGAGGIVEVNEEVPIWVKPESGADTPMAQAVNLAHQIISQWLNDHPNSYPPILVNITDGEATGDDPEPIAEQVKQLSTTDGNVLFWNCHITSNPSNPELFPNEEARLPDQFAQKMFRMSSQIPSSMVSVAKELLKLPGIDQNSRTMAYNTDLVSMIQFIDIGTRTTLR